MFNLEVAQVALEYVNLVHIHDLSVSDAWHVMVGKFAHCQLVFYMLWTGSEIELL
jgi:hypothetical protein